MCPECTNTSFQQTVAPCWSDQLTPWTLICEMIVYRSKTQSVWELNAVLTLTKSRGRNASPISFLCPVDRVEHYFAGRTTTLCPVDKYMKCFSLNLLLFLDTNITLRTYHFSARLGCFPHYANARAFDVLLIAQLHQVYNETKQTNNLANRKRKKPFFQCLCVE